MFGLGGNDRLQGLAGNDRSRRRRRASTARSIPMRHRGITVNLAAGTVTGGCRIRYADQRRRHRRQRLADTFNATGFAGDSGIAGPMSASTSSRAGAATTPSSAPSTARARADAHFLRQRHGGRYGRPRRAHGDRRRLGRHRHPGRIGFCGRRRLGIRRHPARQQQRAGTVEVFDGRAGNDTINGRGGFDRADYALDPATASGITVNWRRHRDRRCLQVGTDTLRVRRIGPRHQFRRHL